MALTRKALKAMGLTDEQVDSIIEMHTDTVDGLKADINKYKGDAEKLPRVQEELDNLKAAGDGGYKEKYEKEHKAFETYKSGVEAKETRAAKEKAVMEYLKGKNVQDANLKLAMRSLSAEIDAAELDGGKLKDTKSFDDSESNLIKKADLARVREIEFTEMFGYSIKKLMEALGVTRKIAKQAGAALKSYKASGTLLDGAVAEGETIPLSKYKTEPVTYKEITLKKWRKATSAEAIIERGYDQAVGDTTDEMLKDVQKGIRKDFFTFLATGTGAASGNTFQAALAQAWGQLQVLFEDDEIGQGYSQLCRFVV